MSLQTKNKKAVSVMIGYVLLVTFVVVMGIIVYNWMKTYVPREDLECPDGVSIFIKDYVCDSAELNLTFINNGKFNVGGYFVYIANASGEEVATVDISNRIMSGEDTLSPVGVKFNGSDNSFTPNEEVTEIFSILGLQTIYSIEVIPIRWQEENRRNRLVSCKDAGIREVVNCAGGGTGCSDSCGSLNYECGTHLVCGVSTDCGSCGSGYVCSGTSCVEESGCTDTCASVGAECGLVCGTDCGTCSLENAQPVCNSSFLCEVLTCNYGYLDCNSISSDGCEVNNQTDNNNCGTCGTICTIGTCDSGICNSCNGTWVETETPNVECDGGLNCLADCTCETGYEPDEAGGCQIPASVDGCNDYCVWLGTYSDGNCRANPSQCTVNGEVYEEGGDVYCDSGSPTSSDCCCAP